MRAFRMYVGTDLVVSQNNGVLAIRPCADGRLVKLIKKTMGATTGEGPKDKCWIFADAHSYTDEAGEERFDHHLRGAVCGTFAEGKKFLLLCEELGITARHTDFFVPCSNGQRRNAHVLRPTPHTHEYMSDYPEEELRLLRFDLPSREMLEAAVAQHESDVKYHVTGQR